MFTRNNIAGILFGIMIVSIWPISASAIDASTNDVRILIDVSGSMKQNDPANLRRPALRLLTGLLNESNRAGIWTFGRYVNMLVPPGAADEEWKDKVRQASSSINSYGLFTNIEGALRDATWDWMTADIRRQRSLILLTDGLVDVSSDEHLDQASRARILDEILPKMQAAGIHIHTIALSDQADSTLLEQMSRATQGTYTTTSTSGELERTFLHMFESSTQADTLPLEGNAVQVDDSIREMTLLIFHDTDAKPTRIRFPNGHVITQSDKPDHIKWHGEQNYDLITIQRPIAGTWNIDAKMDPDNRVVVVTDLKLETDPLPANLAVDEQQQIDIRLSEGGDTIINKELLHFIKVTATQFDGHGLQEQQWTLMDNGMRDDRTENDGIYTLSLDTPLTNGRHEVVIDVDGTTFNRQQRLRFEAFNQPVITAFETTAQGASLYISPVDGLIDVDSIQIMASVDDEPSQAVARTHHNEWVLSLHDYDLSQAHKVTISISGKRGSETIDTQLEPLTFGRQLRHEPESDTDLVKPIDATSTTPEVTSHLSVAPENNHVAGKSSKETQQAQPLSPLTVVTEVLLINLICAVIIFFLYKKFKPKLHSIHQLEELTNE